jgi:hypothetical protein
MQKAPTLDRSTGKMRAIFLMTMFALVFSVSIFWTLCAGTALDPANVVFEKNRTQTQKKLIQEEDRLSSKPTLTPINNTLLLIQRQQDRLAKAYEKRKYLLTLCTTVKNDVPYIVEWVEYMRLQGVDRFIIYNDDSWENLTILNQFYQQKDPSANVVVIPRAGRTRYQLVSFQHCVDTYGLDTQWMLFSDTDEYLYSPSYGTLREMLLDMPALEKEANASIHHVYADCSRFGSAGQKRRFQYRLVERPDGTVDYINPCGVQLIVSHNRRAPHIWRHFEKNLTLQLKQSPICTKPRENQALGCHHGHGKSLFRPEHLVEVGCHYPERMDGTGIQIATTRRKGHMEQVPMRLDCRSIVFHAIVESVCIVRLSPILGTLLLHM